MKKLKITTTLAVDQSAVTQKWAWLGVSGSGKTYAAGVLVEQMLHVGAQVVIVDPVGVWWGLRLAKNGRDPGFKIPIFGGEHADVPLNHRAGALVAQAIVAEDISAVLDVSDLNGSEQRTFVTDFATELLAEKKKHRSPIHVVWDECQDFVPQKVYGETAKMVGAVERLIKKGRNFGIGTSLISQRPQAVNKDVLSQTEILVALQTNEAHARKAIEDWVVSQGRVSERELVRQLPGLERGQAWIWSPRFLKKTLKATIARKITYDASSTPEIGTKARAPRELSKKDFAELGKAMEAALAAEVEERKLSDPASLKARIADLERQLREVKKPEVQLIVREHYVMRKGELKKVEQLIQRANKLANTTARAQLELVAAINRLDETVAKVLTSPDPVHVPLAGAVKLQRQEQKIRDFAARYGGATTSVASALTKAHADFERERAERAPQVRKTYDASEIRESSEPLKKGARAMLAALRDAGAVRGAGTFLTRDQVAIQVGIRARGTTFASYLSSIKTGGYVDEAGDGLFLTEKGAALIGPATKPKTTEEILAHWLPKLKAGERSMLQALVEIYPAPMTRGTLGNVVGITCEGTTFASYLSTLNRSGLVVKCSDGTVQASPTLFPGGK